MPPSGDGQSPGTVVANGATFDMLRSAVSEMRRLVTLEATVRYSNVRNSDHSDERTGIAGLLGEVAIPTAGTTMPVVAFKTLPPAGRMVVGACARHNDLGKQTANVRYQP
jgi:hypothetical protein